MGALKVASLSSIGRVRPHNEDALLVRRWGAWTLLCVADGLGGHARGEWASARALEVFAGAVEQSLQDLAPDRVLQTAAAATNAAIYRESPDIGAPGAATTLVAVLVKDREATWLNVGDSRLYAVLGGQLRQVSQDHSWVAERVREGVLPASAVYEHPRRNVISRTIGFEPAVEADIGTLELDAGDALLLCSDGLFGPVRDEAIGSVLRREPEDAATRLVELANAAGGPDNITVVIARLEP